jgi:hypothetical protein
MIVDSFALGALFGRRKKLHESGEGSFSFLFKFGGFLGRGVFVDMRFEMIWRED